MNDPIKNLRPAKRGRILNDITLLNQEILSVSIKKCFQVAMLMKFCSIIPEKSRINIKLGTWEFPAITDIWL